MGEIRLTYAELGERLGLKPEAARQRAKRRQREGRWRVVLDNNGRALVHLDETDLAGEPGGRPADDRGNVHPDVRADVFPNAPDRSPDHRADDRPDAADRDQLVAELRERITALEAEREALIEAGDALVDQLGAAQVRAARAEGELVATRQARDDLAARLDQATAELRELRRPWWRRWLG